MVQHPLALSTVFFACVLSSAPIASVAEEAPAVPTGSGGKDAVLSLFQGRARRDDGVEQLHRVSRERLRGSETVRKNHKSALPAPAKQEGKPYISHSEHMLTSKFLREVASSVRASAKDGSSLDRAAARRAARAAMAK
eukprot:CAMPEP_0170613906 /NCGR_PEP_ID=MMETSP0224-20130122/24518_1 /TAXON_ID=285029 /ORGANISM="Togula jolla, Strain CCCM 725" /LENGTH=137 /DNA_ID=CAMNT_0010939531 /DNA_START=57 /DNA_END=470 /DNA_ORIENTATION=-